MTVTCKDESLGNGFGLACEMYDLSMTIVICTVCCNLYIKLPVLHHNHDGSFLASSPACDDMKVFFLFHTYFVNTLRVVLEHLVVGIIFSRFYWASLWCTMIGSSIAASGRTFILTFGLPACLVQSRKPAKFVRPTALWWEDAGLSACSLAMIKVRLVLKETLFHFILLSNILRFIPDGSFIFSSAVHLQQAGMRVPWSWRTCLMSLIGAQTNDC